MYFSANSLQESDMILIDKSGLHQQISALP